MILEPKQFLKFAIDDGWTYEDVNGVVKGFMTSLSTDISFLLKAAAENKKIYITIESKNSTVFDILTMKESIAKTDKHNTYCLAFPLLNLVSD